MIRALLHDRKGGSMIEFALLAPTFLMFIFLLLDGGRMLFAKQSLNEVATATARCYAIKSANCSDAASARTWAINRGLTRDNLAVSDVTFASSCDSGLAGAKVTVSTVFKKGAMTLLPQSVAPSTLTSTACFPTTA
jgi:Flp pilus assembly protein TadG